MKVLLSRVFSVASLLLLAHCGGSPDGAPALAEPYAAGNNAGSEGMAPCQDGLVRDCKVVVGHHDGYTDCYKGVEVCENGAWGACEGRERVQLEADGGEVDAGASEAKKK